MALKDYVWNECNDSGNWVCFDASNTDAAAGSAKLLYVRDGIPPVADGRGVRLGCERITKRRRSYLFGGCRRL